jgi:transglutaminase/protease-like cytokinesis protein 3
MESIAISSYNVKVLYIDNSTILNYNTRKRSDAMKKITKAMFILILSFVVLTPITYPLTTQTVIAEAASVKISKTKLSLNTGDVVTLKITGTTKKITWSTSDKSVATVSSKGKVTAKNSGSAVITASVNGTKITCKVTVVDAASSATKK